MWGGLHLAAAEVGRVGEGGIEVGIICMWGMLHLAAAEVGLDDAGQRAVDGPAALAVAHRAAGGLPEGSGGFGSYSDSEGLRLGLLLQTVKQPRDRQPDRQSRL